MPCPAIVQASTCVNMQILPKPNRTAQRFYEGTKPVAFTQNIFAKEKTTETVRPKNMTDFVYIGFMVTMHLLCFAAPFTFSWANVGLFAATYFLTGCLGITLSFHRQLAHKSFRTPKWLEYFFAYCGALAVQGDPKEWVSTHRCAVTRQLAPVPVLLDAVSVLSLRAHAGTLLLMGSCIMCFPE